MLSSFSSSCKEQYSWVLLELGSVTQFTSVVSGTQGDYDPSKTKVLHFSMNPASLAKQQRKEEQQQLQEECERLRELVRVLEAGGSVHGNLEGVGSFQSPQEVAGRLLASRHEDLLIHLYCQRNWLPRQMETLQTVCLLGWLWGKWREVGLLQEMCGSSPMAGWYRGEVVTMNSNNPYHLLVRNEMPV